MAAPSSTGLSSFTDTYTTFSGADIVCTFGSTIIGTLSGITWSITREKAPIYTMGSPNPRSFSRGKRGIAGSMIFTVFDQPSLYKMLLDHKGDNSAKYFTRTSNILPGTGEGQVTHRGITPAAEQSLSVEAAFPYYADQIPPFDITITFANEYGQAAVRRIYGVELLNEGSGASMDDIVIEETMTYVAREIGPMYATGQPRTPADFTNPTNALDPTVIRI
jgi:hypothetical protein